MRGWSCLYALNRHPDFSLGIISVKLAFYPPLVELLLATGDTQIWDASDPEVRALRFSAR